MTKPVQIATWDGKPTILYNDGTIMSKSESGWVVIGDPLSLIKGPPKKKKVNLTPVLSDDQFIETLKNSNAYAGIDIDVELGKMDAWLSTRPRRKKTRRFVVNWLNNEDAPLGGGNGKSVVEKWAEKQGVNIYEDNGEGSGNTQCLFPEPEPHGEED